MQFSVLGSGSRGNSVFIETGKTAILIDAGFSGKEIERRLTILGKRIEELDAIFVTHEHNDHIGGVGVLSRRCKIPVFANSATLKGGEKKLGRLFQKQEFGTGENITFQDLEVKSFRISHDTNDPVGYVMSNGEKSVGYCTDTGTVSHLMVQRLRVCNGLILEFNHDLQLLKNCPYPLFLQQRVRSSYGHLANEDAADFLKNLIHDKLSHVFLAHLSETNNLPELALQEARKSVDHESETRIHLSWQNSPSEIIAL